MKIALLVDLCNMPLGVVDATSDWDGSRIMAFGFGGGSTCLSLAVGGTVLV